MKQLVLVFKKKIIFGIGVVSKASRDIIDPILAEVGIIDTMVVFLRVRVGRFVNYR